MFHFTIFTSVAEPRDYIEYRNSRLYYAKAGQGRVPLLIFHGFGQTSQAMQEWVDALSGKYRLYFFDLYFHGQSQWNESEPVEKKDWQNILTEFFKKEIILEFEVAGFSLGGKFALAALEAFPERVKKIILLAPDGIKTSFWYSLATYPLLIRYAFRSMVLHPGRFYGIARFMRKLGLMDKGIVRFAESQMDTEEKRRRVYNSWVHFRHLKFNLEEIGKSLNKNRVPLLMVVGTYDKVIPVGNMHRLLRHLKYYHLEILESGHQDLIRQSTTVLTKEFTYSATAN